MNKMFFQKYEVDTQQMRITFSCASDFPYYKQQNGKQFYEVLQISESAIDFSRLNNGAPLLWQHQTEKQIGIVEKAWIEGNKIVVRVKFRRNDQFSVSVFNDILDGTIKNISVGYLVNHYKEQRIDGYLYHKVDKFMIFEISVVSIPADNTVGIRSFKIGDKKNMEEENKEVEQTVEQTEKQTTEATEEQTEEAVEQTVETAEEQVVEQAVETTEELTEEQKELIEQIAKDFSVSEERKMAVLNKKISLREFKNQIFEQRQEKKQMKSFRDFLSNGAKGEKGTYELRAFNGVSANGVVGNTTTEIADIISKKLGIKGYKTLSGLTNNVTIPVMGRPTVNELDLNGTAVASKPTFEGRTLAPKKFVGEILVGEDLLLQSNDDVEAFVIQALTNEISAKLQAYMLGKAKEYAQEGFLHTGINTVTWNQILEQEGKIGGYMVNPSYVLSASARATLKGIEKATGTAQFICDSDNKINGYDANVSGCVTDDTIYFGDWSHLVLGIFGGGLEVLIDPYTHGSQGAVKIVASLRADATVDSNDAFAFGVND